MQTVIIVLMEVLNFILLFLTKKISIDVIIGIRAVMNIILIIFAAMNIRRYKTETTFRKVMVVLLVVFLFIGLIDVARTYLGLVEINEDVLKVIPLEDQIYLYKRSLVSDLFYNITFGPVLIPIENKTE